MRANSPNVARLKGDAIPKPYLYRELGSCPTYVFSGGDWHLAGECLFKATPCKVVLYSEWLSSGFRQSRP